MDPIFEASRSHSQGGSGAPKRRTWWKSSGAEDTAACSHLDIPRIVSSPRLEAGREGRRKKNLQRKISKRRTRYHDTAVRYRGQREIKKDLDETRSDSRREDVLIWGGSKKHVTGNRCSEMDHQELKKTQRYYDATTWQSESFLSEIYDRKRDVTKALLSCFLNSSDGNSRERLALESQFMRAIEV